MFVANFNVFTSRREVVFFFLSFLFNLVTAMVLSFMFLIYSIRRSRADSNRCTRFCRPLPSHSATRPVEIQGCKASKYKLSCNLFMQISTDLRTYNCSGYGNIQGFCLANSWYGDRMRCKIRHLGRNSFPFISENN
jgi:hypothetical protein